MERENNRTIGRIGQGRVRRTEKDHPGRSRVDGDRGGIND